MHHLLKRSLMAALFFATPLSHAGFLDFIKDIDTTKLTLPSADQIPTGLSNGDMVSGLKQALEKGTTVAIKNLGAEGGFLNHTDVKIPIPTALQPIASSLKMLGQGDLVDGFQNTLNKAAEKAAPEAAAIFSNTIQQMSIDDAASIIKGPDNAATEYFKQHSSAQLLEKFLPTVKQATENAGVTASYKQLVSSAGGFSGLIASQAPDLDSFVAQKAIDGLFLRIAEQEKLIRENPAARTTDLLKKVFTP